MEAYIPFFHRAAPQVQTRGTERFWGSLRRPGQNFSPESPSIHFINSAFPSHTQSSFSKLTHHLQQFIAVHLYERNKRQQNMDQTLHYPNMFNRYDEKEYNQLHC